MQIISVEQRVYVGSVGVVIDLICRDYNYAYIDLSVAGTTVFLMISRPDDDVVTKTATYAGTSHEIIRYTSVTDDFDIAGIYSLQGKIVTATATIYSEPVELQVRELFDEE